MKNPLTLRSLFAVASAAFLCAASTQGAPLIDVNFSTMTSGSSVVIASPPVTPPLTTATPGSSIPSGTTMMVQSGFTATESPYTSFGSGNVLVYDRTSAGSSSALNFEVADANVVYAGIVSMRFDLMVDNRTTPTPTGNFFIGFRNVDYNTISSFMLGNNLALTFFPYSAPGSPGTGQSLGTLSAATSYAIEVRLNYSTGMAQTYVNNVATGTSHAFATTGGVRGFSLSTSSATLGQWAFDNIAMEVIPEPASITLLVLSAGVLLLRRRRVRASDAD